MDDAIDRAKRDAIDRAKRGDLEFFKEAQLEILLNARDSNDDDTVLSIVVNDNRRDCCEVICKRCPSLLRHHTRQDGSTPLHIAAYNGYVDILKLLISTCEKADQGGDRADKQKTLTLTNKWRFNAMHKAVYGRQTETIQWLIDADPNNELLKAGDFKKNTPLHLAVGLKAERERARIARLLIKADPGFPYGANSDKKTPLLMAIDKAESQDDREMLELILELQPTQSMRKVNDNGWTALHYSASEGYFKSIGYILQYCPESCSVADNEGQNFFHHAVKSGNVNMVKHILGMKGIAKTVLNNQDKVGKTPLDAAALTGQESITLCLLEDPRVDKKLAEAKHLHLQWVVEKHNLVMMDLLIEANPDFLKKIDLEVLLNSRDENGDTILFKAAQGNHLLLCKEIYERCPSLIYHQSKGKRTVLHNAASTGKANMLEFLINAAILYNENEEDDIECGGGDKMPQKLLTMEDELGDTALHKAVLNQKLEAVRLLIDATKDFEYTTNASGETPLMIAIRITQSNENTRDSGKIKKLLFEMLPDQAKACTGDKKWTLLHHAAYDGGISVIKDIIKFCPSCLELVDNEGKNFLHIAAEWEMVQVVKHVLGAKKKIADSVLNHQDNEGNTPFHIAAQTGNEAMTRHFLYDRRIGKNTKNKIGEHVLHSINFSYNKRKAGVLGIIDTVDQSDLRDQSDFDLVVGALIATVSFAAGITVPGGYNSEGPNQGTAVFSKQVSFAAFIISNTFALIFSLYAVFSHFCARRMLEEEDIIYQLKVATLCTLAAMCCMMVAFIAGSFAVLANSNWLAIVVCIIGCLFFVSACRPMWKIAMQRKRAASASQHKHSA